MLFDDSDAFGRVFDAKPIIDTALEKQHEVPLVQVGDHPILLHFTGKYRVVEADTELGKVSVDHRPGHVEAGTSGVSIKNRLALSIEPENPVNFSDALARMHQLACFLSMAAGRSQALDRIEVMAGETIDDIHATLSVYPSFPWGANDGGEQNKPDSMGIPLNPIQRQEEFKSVLTNWIHRHSGWRLARVRYLACQRKANAYDPERLVAAANMFDISPPDAVPAVNELLPGLAVTREACVSLFKEHPSGIDRDSALSALGRLGKPSLPKKVAHRIAIIDQKLNAQFPDLQFVATTAIKCRNYFVHGSSDGFNYQRVENSLSFLTDTLEFIFAASDLIESGWDAQRWGSDAFPWGHSFCLHHNGYRAALDQLRLVIAK